jgi:hypothetical protein
MVDQSVTLSDVHLLLTDEYEIDRGQQLSYRAIVPQPFCCSSLARGDALLLRVGQHDHARRANLTPQGREVIDVRDDERVGRPMFNFRDASDGDDVKSGIVQSSMKPRQARRIGLEQDWTIVQGMEYDPHIKVFRHGTPLGVANARRREPAVLAPRRAAARTLIKSESYRKEFAHELPANSEEKRVAILLRCWCVGQLTATHSAYPHYRPFPSPVDPGAAK